MFFREEIVKFLGIAPDSFFASALEACVALFIVLGVYLIIKNTLIKVIKASINKSENDFIINLSKSKILRNMTLVIPFAVLYSMKGLFLNKVVANIYEKSIFTTLVIVSVMLIFSVFNVLSTYYEENDKVSEKIPVKPFFQILKVILFLVAIMVIIAHFVDRSPVYILSAVGAASAIIMFIFKDTLQSFIASFQVTLHKSVKVGDWIEVPKYAVDGEVKEINLNLISVKNWDNTTTVIPTYCLLTESFKNWTTMFKNGRRIKRAINIDVNSIKQLTSEDIERLKKVKLIRQYLEEKENDLLMKNKDLGNDELLAVNGKKLTNIGTFRKYVEYYLRQHHEIIQDQMLVVRQLENKAEGLPIEVYCFTKKTFLMDFEPVQADIFDHLYSVITLFGLRVYQSPSGDFSTLGQEIGKTIIDERKRK
jgi:miniconductance mechanosensitive channel